MKKVRFSFIKSMYLSVIRNELKFKFMFFYFSCVYVYAFYDKEIVIFLYITLKLNYKLNKKQHKIKENCLLKQKTMKSTNTALI